MHGDGALKWVDFNIVHHQKSCGEFGVVKHEIRKDKKVQMHEVGRTS